MVLGNDDGGMLCGDDSAEGIRQPAGTAGICRRSVGGAEPGAVRAGERFAVCIPRDWIFRIDHVADGDFAGAELGEGASWIVCGNSLHWDHGRRGGSADHREAGGRDRSALRNDVSVHHVRMRRKHRTVGEANHYECNFSDGAEGDCDALSIAAMQPSSHRLQ